VRARHGGVASPQLPGPQRAEAVAAVTASTLDSGAPPVYTRAGAHDMVVKFYDANGTDPM
jgi:hypothetical protein